MEALKALGYRNAELSVVHKELAAMEGLHTDEYIRKALGILAKKSGV